MPEVKLLSPEEVKCADGEIRKLHPIQNVSTFIMGTMTIKAGAIGGYVESAENISGISRCWIDHGAKVYGDSIIRDRSYVGTGVEVFDSTVSGGSTIYGAFIKDHSEISDSYLNTSGAHIIRSTLIRCRLDERPTVHRCCLYSSVIGQCHISECVGMEAHIGGGAFVQDCINLTRATVWSDTKVWSQADIVVFTVPWAGTTRGLRSNYITWTGGDNRWTFDINPGNRSLMADEARKYVNDMEDSWVKSKLTAAVMLSDFVEECIAYVEERSRVIAARDKEVAGMFKQK